MGHSYAYDLTTLGAYYKEYERIMQHWCEVLPIKMLEIKYEELVADQERVTREMIDYIGLPWDERCLQPEKSNKVVRTASLWQARQPVYKTSVARWKHYEKHLQPLKDVLGYREE
jgi:LPS sulfotransferase NodH